MLKHDMDLPQANVCGHSGDGASKKERTQRMRNSKVCFLGNHWGVS